MGNTTPNLSIYIPAQGETLYTQSFAAGMNNIDAHDHSGGPNKGLPITTSGLADFSVTFNKLNANVVDTTTGLQVSGVNPNQIQNAPIIASLFQNATPSGLLAKNGTSIFARTLTNGAGGSFSITNADGASGNPTFNLTGINLLNNAFSAGDGSTATQLGDNVPKDVIFTNLENIQPAASTAYNVATGEYTIPTTGYYLIIGFVDVQGISGAGNETFLNFNINGADDQSLFHSGTDNNGYGGSAKLTFGGSYTKLLNSGAVVKLRVLLNQAAANSVTVTGGRFQMVQLC